MSALRNQLRKVVGIETSRKDKLGYDPEKSFIWPKLFGDLAYEGTDILID